MPASPRPAGGTEPRAGGSDLKVLLSFDLKVMGLWKFWFFSAPPAHGLVWAHLTALSVHSECEHHPLESWTIKNDKIPLLHWPFFKIVLDQLVWPFSGMLDQSLIRGGDKPHRKKWFLMKTLIKKYIYIKQIGVLRDTARASQPSTNPPTGHQMSQQGLAKYT